MKSKNFFRASAEDFKKIPGSPVAYWVSERMRCVFSKLQRLGNLYLVRQGLATGENNRFVRQWFEVSNSQISLGSTSRAVAVQTNKKWFPYNKGGSYRKWWGNQDCVVNWKEDGKEIRSFVDDKGKLKSRPQNMETYFRSSVSWSKISSAAPAFRSFPAGFIYDVAGTSIFANDKDGHHQLIGFCNSIVARKMLEILSPTLNFEVGHIASLPIKECTSNNVIASLQDHSRADWNDYETSWDFAANPLIAVLNSEREKTGGSSGEAAIRNQASDGTLQGIYQKVRAGWAANCEEMRRLETENNRIFIEAYGLQDELTPEVPWHEITLTCNPWYRYGVSAPRSEDAAGAMPKDVKLEERLRADTVKELIS